MIWPLGVTKWMQLRFAFEAVELQIDLQPGFPLGQGRDEIRVGCDPQPIGIEHQMADRAGLRGIDHGEDIGVQRRLAARNLQRVRLFRSGAATGAFRRSSGMKWLSVPKDRNGLEAKRDRQQLKEGQVKYQWGTGLEEFEPEALRGIV